MSAVNVSVTKFLMTLVILIDFMGMAMVVVLFPNLFLDSNSGLFSSDWSYSNRLILLGFSLAIYPVGQFFGSSIFGKLSDHYGRKNILTWTIVGTLTGFLLSFFSVYIGSFYLLFTSRLLTGFCAGNVAIAQASLVDISTEETKAKNLSLGQMAMGAAYVFGPSIAGILADSHVVSWFNPSIPFLFFCVLLFVELIVLLLFYRDTLGSAKLAKINLSEGIRQIYIAFVSPKLSSFFAVWFAFVCGWWLFESFMPSFLYQKFNFNTSQIGYLLSFNGLLYAAIQYLIIQRISHKIKPENIFLYVTLFSGSAIVSVAFAGSLLGLYMTMIAFILFSAFALSALVTSISNMSDKEDQGQIMGMMSSIQALGTVLVMIVGGYIQAIDIHITIIGGGLLVILSWLLFFRLRGYFRYENITN